MYFSYFQQKDNEEIIRFSKDMLDARGCGLSSVRFICGTQDIHKVRKKRLIYFQLNYSFCIFAKELESKISKFHCREDTILYASCFDANAGIFEVILTPDDAVFSDELNHASIIDGIRLCKAQKSRYQHRNMTGNYLSYEKKK